MLVPTGLPASFLEPWEDLLASHQAEQVDDFPNHCINNWDCLTTTSRPRSLHLGTGYSVYRQVLFLAILSVRESVHFVTCYWTASPTRDAFRDALICLARSRAAQESVRPLHITIGFSSSGLFQKLFHTSSREGFVYSPSRWARLGLPDQDILRSGRVELTVKSLFFTPLSVIHPKYVIIDGIRAFMPSCNVSWERWLEGCIELEGQVVSAMLEFHERVWGTGKSSDARDSAPKHAQRCESRNEEHEVSDPLDTSSIINDISLTQFVRFAFPDAIPTVLPSPHHRNPRFGLAPFKSRSKPPMTPLNAALLTAFANAKVKIQILTPNLTYAAMLDGLLQALARGVDVEIRTSKNLMLIEQLVTAGTTTLRSVQKLIKKYKKLQSQTPPFDVEAQPVSTGNLEISYFKPLPNHSSGDDEPTASHFKMTMVDDRYWDLGSGNMDRASWWTSQELGVLLFAPNLQGYMLWDRVLTMRAEVLFRSKDH